MPRRSDQFQRALRKKYKNIITTKLKNIWPEIIISQKLNQNHRKNNRYQGNLRNKF